ncbi:D-2-hydroxyacid dehydrogenase [Virgibacillus necropolis]|uniref:D-2-hydroxyacid dehydrogenase n=1 Tax=Virgibacillus necropolis TaxID=163877 RepID=A0A221MGS1_9BACI|nr:D-2-hydroxyacid dehydrogenase [Virgibacillus necropolis]ASN06863.1 D-2-hydroxyacid dehydrogenase [Virgibacillus necropolis]
MGILFSAKVSVKHQSELKRKFSNESFTFCDNIGEAKPHLADAEVLVTYGEDLTDELIEKVSKLKWIMVLSAGMDQMPFTTIGKKGILVTNARGIHKIPMAEYAISSILQVSRQSKKLIENENNHTWDRAVRMQEITGKTILIAGTGAIGQEVARLAQAFRMKTYGVSRSGSAVEYFDKIVKSDEMEKLLPEVDIVVSVLPSTPETMNFFTDEHFRLLPDHAIFLNMGRGNAVSGTVLLEAIQSNQIAHAILDVFEEEPLPADHPFWKEENVTITPHLSGISAHYQTRALEIFEQNLHTYKQNGSDFLNKIDLTRGY